MKTLTELSGSVIRVAATAIAEASRSLPSDEQPAAPAVQESPAQGAEAVAKATGLSGDRLTMVLGAVEAAGRRTEDVRAVRVFALEEQVTGATKVGAYQYVVDLFPASMKQDTAPRDDRGRRGGGRGSGRGGGDRGAKGGGVGGFSMDSLREDRRNERGGRGGHGAGRSGGGGGGGGGRAGVPPAGGPKK